MATNEKNNNEGIIINISILQEFVLNIENEQKYYEKSFESSTKEKKDITNKYKHSLEIERFLQQLSKLTDEKEIEESYSSFINQDIYSNLKYGDVFSVDLKNFIDNKKVNYSLKLNKVNTDYFLPSIGKLKLFQSSEAIKLAGEKALTGSIQVFEKYFEIILKHLIMSKPDAYLHDKTITYAELINTDIDQLKKELIEEKVSKMMHGVKETISIINKIHKLNLEKYQDLWDCFIELDLHRNILVHNNGRVNETYLNSVPKKFNNVQVGDYIKCDKKCIETKLSNLIKFGYLIFYLVSEGNYEFDVLEETAFDFLKKEKWELAEFAYSLLEKVNILSHSQKLICKINQLNSKKHLLGLEKVKKEIELLDISGMEQKFSIAKDLLLENNDKVTDELEKCYPKTYNSYAICTWPLFVEYRKTNEYQEFKERHKDDFEPYEFKDDE